MTKIIAFSGVKQSGKTTCVNFLHGVQLIKNNIIEDFGIDENNSLIVFRGEESGVMDLFRTDDDFINYAVSNIWQYIKSYSFADSLKYTCLNLFGLTKEQCFGTDEEKNSKVDIMWESMPDNIDVKFDDEYYDLVPKKKGSMTAREFMQYFGTNICRKIKPDIWTEDCINRIKREQSEIAVIGDCRFPNEVEAVQKAGGKVVRLTRQIYEDSHSSETALDEDKYDWKNFDAVVDNSGMSIKETNNSIQKLISDWGW